MRFHGIFLQRLLTISLNILILGYFIILLSLDISVLAEFLPVYDFTLTVIKQDENPQFENLD